MRDTTTFTKQTAINRVTKLDALMRAIGELQEHQSTYRLLMEMPGWAEKELQFHANNVGIVPQLYAQNHVIADKKIDFNGMLERGEYTELRKALLAASFAEHSTEIHRLDALRFSQKISDAIDTPAMEISLSALKRLGENASLLSEDNASMKTVAPSLQRNKVAPTSVAFALDKKAIAAFSGIKRALEYAGTSIRDMPDEILQDYLNRAKAESNMTAAEFKNRVDALVNTAEVNAVVKAADEISATERSLR